MFQRNKVHCSRIKPSLAFSIKGDMINILPIYLYMDVMIYIRYFRFRFNIQYLEKICAYLERFECVPVMYCKYSSKAWVEAVKFVSAENCKCITKYIHMCLRPRVGPSPDPLSDGLASQWMCVLHTAAADRRVTLAEQVEAAAMRSSAQTHDTGRWPKREGAVWRGGKAAGVYVNVYGICLYACP